MRQVRFACVATALVCAACSDNPTSLPQPDVQGASHDISDATHGSNGNPHFFWLAPMVAQPDSGLGTFEGMASPRVDLVCWDNNQPDVTCDRDTPLASFDRDNGLEVADQQFDVNVDTDQWELVATVDPDTAFTTYRLIVYTDSMADFGGRFPLGYADIQLGAHGSDVKNLSTGETIGLVDGRTLPVRFRIDAGAYEYALKDNLATGTGDPQDQPLCQTSCSVTFVSPDSTTYAFLSDSSGQQVTGAEILPGDVSTPSVLLIDERITDGPNANCADGVSLDKKHCYRYRITPDSAFTDPIRIGICPGDVPIDPGSPWRILKVDYDANMSPILTRPDPVDVSDFLPCTSPTASASFVQAAFHYAARWLVSPLLAQTEARVWGAMARDLSDLFWGLDAKITPVGSTDFTVATGTVVTPTVQVDSVLPADTLKPFDGAEVTFRITAGDGALSFPALPTDEDTVSSETTDGRVTSMTVRTGSSGLASIGWMIANGADTLEVTWADTVTAADLQPIVFTATPEFTVSGTIRYSHDLVAGLPVSLVQYGTRFDQDTTDANGRYQLGPVPAGLYQLCFPDDSEYAGVCTDLMDVSSDLIHDQQIFKWLYRLTPTDQATVSSPQPDFVWSSVPEAAVYLFHIWHELSASNLEVFAQASTGTDTTFTPSSPLVAGETYLWDVAAYDDTGNVVGQSQDGPVEFYVGEGSWTPAAGDMTSARATFVAVLLPSGPDAGKVLVLGGASGGADLLDPAAGTFASIADPVYGHGQYATGTVLQDGSVLIAGGRGSGPDFMGAELYHPDTRTFTATGDLSNNRLEHSATLLPDGRVALIGGIRAGPSGDTTLFDAEVYDPASGAFSPAPGRMTSARYGHSAVLLPTGKVLVAGGSTTTGSILSGAELFDPAAGTFEPTGSMTQALFSCGQAASLLADGHVLVLGVDLAPSPPGAQLYDYNTGTFSAAAQPNGGRRLCASQTLLADGRVLLAGGMSLDHSPPIPANTVEIYDPTQNVFVRGASMVTGRTEHQAVLLPDGRVVVIGGWAGDGSTWWPLASAEFFNLP